MVDINTSHSRYEKKNNYHAAIGASIDRITFYAPNKSRVLIIACKADDFCLSIGLPDEIQKKSPGIVIQFRI